MDCFFGMTAISFADLDDFKRLNVSAKYEIMFYPTEWNEYFEEEVVNTNVPEHWGTYDTEEEAIDAILKFTGVQLANSYIHAYDCDTIEELWNDVWYGDDVLLKRNHPKEERSFI